LDNNDNYVDAQSGSDYLRNVSFSVISHYVRVFICTLAC